jgi:hypothetical protein
MGKFFEALRKSENFKKGSLSPPPSRKVVKISTETVEALKLDTTPPEAPEKKSHHSDGEHQIIDQCA